MSVISNFTKSNLTYDAACQFKNSHMFKECIEMLIAGEGFNGVDKGKLRSMFEGKGSKGISISIYDSQTASRLLTFAKGCVERYRDSPATKKVSGKGHFRAFDLQKANETMRRARDCRSRHEEIECIRILSIATGFTLHDKSIIKQSIPKQAFHPGNTNNFNDQFVDFAQQSLDVAQRCLDSHSSSENTPKECMLSSVGTVEKSEELEDQMNKILSSSSFDISSTATILSSTSDISDSTTSSFSTKYDDFSGGGQLLKSVKPNELRRKSTSKSSSGSAIVKAEKQPSLVAEFVKNLNAGLEFDNSSFSEILSTLDKYSDADLKYLCQSLINTDSETQARYLMATMLSSSKDYSDLVEILEDGLD